ncbi:Antirepressor regulating drug resistance, predicted signal transduction N-terminal membrane component [Sphingobacterium spiritivorum]|uniref:Antirepressor regulating drug resistance, predicted signal transduction N-terminal membrane component n=1 Tax=Sphingobacterium spiritivorum TaxID=258 RepID=A0A380B8V4_SPHSI|nr:M56 family metallopeptidase [Sphingobacterium spiritivorum]SUI96936.1 Antirepressor regulating drug resistance, predicted signal transduction N-terminal membrane component [Sphingobacterium spiritivorum]
MENLLYYSIQTNLLLIIVYVSYIGLLKNLTFYALNRVYFLTGIIFSFIYPFLDIKSWFSKPIIAIGEYLTILPQMTDPAVKELSLNDIIIAVLVAGASILLIRFLVQLASLLRIHMYSRPAQWRTFIFRNVWIPIVPFSFLNKIYVNKSLHEDLELADIFHHEEIHVKGKHSFDILLSELTLIFCWYNPFVWLMRKAIRQNLEFLTDQQVLNNGADRKTYQYSLLHVTKQGAAIGIGNQFNFKTLKRRIMMMNKKRSSKLQLSKYAFLLPVFIFTGAALTVNQAEARIEKIVSVTKATALDVSLPALKQDTVKVIKVVGEANVDKTVREKVIINKKDTTINKIIIRSASSGKQPMYMVNGKEITKEDVDNIRPDDITSINVLKDASATSLYGTKGENGVIMITLKNGNSGVVNTGDASTFKKDSVDKFVRGKVTGVTILKRGDNQAGGASQLHIRGLKEGKDPMVIIDNKIQEGSKSLKDLDPNSIESIEILKDAAATVLHGSKAENGVIKITTKKKQIEEETEKK